MKQTKMVSLVEVLVNIGTGFMVAMLVWHFVIPEFFPRMAGPVAENFTVTLIFTVTSIFRSYLWRRFFNNGFNHALVNWIGRVAGAENLKIVGGDHKPTYSGDDLPPCGMCGCSEQDQDHD